MARVFDVGVNLRPDTISRQLSKLALQIHKKAHRAARDPGNSEAWIPTQAGRPRLRTPTRYLLKTLRVRKFRKGVYGLGWTDDEGLIPWIQVEAAKGVRYFTITEDVDEAITKYLEELPIFRVT